MSLPKDPAKREEYLNKNRKQREKMFTDPEWLRKNKEMLQQRSKDPEWLRKIKERALERLSDPEWLRKNKELGKQNSDNYIRTERITESKIGGFWYGNVRYRCDYNHYCELWNNDLKNRIDVAQNYKSILSGKTKNDNIVNGKPRALDRHHVYWQKKACCEWDEDVEGYFCWLNVGTPKKPNKVKYYIREDPNKFVLLTSSEHQMVKKDKLKWIKLFEDLIESKLGGVCYLPKGMNTY